MRHQNTLDASQTALVIIDMQDAFRGAISDFAELAARTALIAHAAQLLGVPVIVTEQYPKGLGRTAAEIRAALNDDCAPIEKTSFSACGAPEFLERLTDTHCHQILLCGVETHVCVSQTAHDLLAEGYQAHLLQDCTGSRHEPDKQAGLAKMDRSGALLTTTETALFELLRDSRHEHFKAIQKLIK